MKLLICDDDISTIDVIQSQLNCQELGISSILRAYNGEAAKDMILKEKPELILCDIGMPKVDGMEVLKFIDEHHIHTEFAFLTCFDDFEHARGAIRYGACNYLTKPVDFQELNEALHRMTDAAVAYRSQFRDPDSVSRSDAGMNNLLRQLQMGAFGASSDRVTEALRKNRIADIQADTPVRLILFCGDLTEASKSSQLRDRIISSFGTDVEKALTDYTGLRFTVVDVSDRYISSFTPVRADRFSESDCLARARELIRFCSDNYALHPVGLIGRESPFSSLSDTFSGLRTQMRRVLLRAGNVFLQRDVEMITGSEISVIDEEKLLRIIRQRDREAFLSLVSGALSSIACSQKDTGSLMAVLHKDISAAISNCLQDNRIPVRELLHHDQFRKLDLYAERSPADMLAFAAHFFDGAIMELECSADAAGLVDAVKHYIRQHYREDLTRNDLAEVVHITPNYLSKRFHTETGMSLREYINQLRIEDAKRLLLSTNITISEIASEVGFDNISYFSTVFRKLCGVSPIEWSSGKKAGEDSPCE